MTEDDEGVKIGLAGLRRLALLAVFWVGVALLAGTAEFLSTTPGARLETWPQTTLGPLVAGLLWMPLTILIVRANSRYPPFKTEGGVRIVPVHAVAHGVASLAVTFVLNAAFLAILRSDLLLTPLRFTELAALNGLRFLHFNIGGYWVIALGTLVVPLVVRRSRVTDSAMDASDQTLTVRAGPLRVRVRVPEIRWIEGAGDYVRLHLAESNHLYSERLKRLEERLDPKRFVRVHRSAIVNVAAVERLRHRGHGDYEAILDNGARVRVSRRRWARLRRVLESKEVPGADPRSPTGSADA